MSIRASIIVKDPNSIIYLYRHCDGYPDGIGSELNECLNNIKNKNHLSAYDIVGRILTGGVDDVKYTTGIHGDIEYKYIIEVQETPKLRSFERINFGIHKTTEEEAWKEIFPEFLKVEHNQAFKPKTKEELKELVERLIEERGNSADLNDIDTSLITNMSCLFLESNFNGDISKWDVSNVENMSWMFCDSLFNGDISKWDVSKVENMGGMFRGSDFNGDISKWDVSKVKFTRYMFCDSCLEGNEPKWYKRVMFYN